jgi:hypothetical protein
MNPSFLLGIKSLAEPRTGVRELDKPPTDGDGHFEDTGDYDQVKEAHRRDGFFQVFQYSDTAMGNPRIFDPAGLYVCSGCNKFMEGGGCTLVEGPIDGAHGSCRHWENKCAGDPELEMATKISKDMADYGETPNVGFSCKRCEYHRAAREADSQGRYLFCNQGAFRIMGDACCALNDAPGMKTEFKEGS